MCDVGAHCPNCDSAGLDDDEIECWTQISANLNMIWRRYVCHHCSAEITVQLVIPDDVPPLDVIKGGRNIDR